MNHLPVRRPGFWSRLPLISSVTLGNHIPLVLSLSAYKIKELKLENSYKAFLDPRDNDFLIC